MLQSEYKTFASFHQEIFCLPLGLSHLLTIKYFVKILVNVMRMPLRSARFEVWRLMWIEVEDIEMNFEKRGPREATDALIKLV